MDLTIKVEGLQEVKRALQELPKRSARNVLRKAVAAGAAILRDEVKRVAPIRSYGKAKKRGSKGVRTEPGFLKKKISYKYRKDLSKFNEVHYEVKPRGWAFYGRFVEEGHAIVGRGRKQTSARRRERRRGASRSSFGMVAPRPFMGPAFYRTRNRIILRMQNKLSEGIIKEGQILGFQARL